jgi:DNA repair exonuclease SbcCD nuclease subunit
MDGGVFLINNKNGYVGIVLADTHAGAFDADQWYKELEVGVLDYVNKLAILDFLIISGDFFDTKISLNSEHAKNALRFLTKLLKVCGKKGAKVRILKGTESHDNKQVELFDILYSNTECDFKVIHSVEKEMLFEDMNVLYIPEEYMTNKDEYYEEYFNDTYDMIFGHGMVDKAAFVALTQESEATMSKAPIFKTEDLEMICKGPIYFGHIHKRMEFGRFRYINSFSRWAFGEEDDKGYYLVAYTPSTGEFTEEYILNKLARQFNTVKIDYRSPIFSQTEKDQVDYLVQIVESLKIDFIRLEIHIPEEYPNSKLLVTMINEVFSNYKHVKLKINNNGKLKQEKETEQKINLLLEKFGFIFDKGITYEDKISRYIKTKYARNISPERVKHYLFEGISKGDKPN